MFSGCSSLSSLDLSNFITSSVTNMYRMFYRCSSLTSLDLSNFNTSSVTTMNYMLRNCEKLEYINLKFASINPNIISSNLFSNLPSKLTVCSENEEWKEIFDLLYIQYINCINKESSFNINGNINKIKCFKNNNTEIENACQICGNNYFEINVINNTYINCYEYKEGYYFDDIELNYKPCYSSCKKCDKNGNKIEHNCIECKEEYIYEFNLLIYKNCFNIENRTELIQNMLINLFTKLSISNIDNGNDEQSIYKNISIIITSTKNLKNNENKKMIIIDLGKCENILKDIYNISKNDSLYMLQIISKEEEGMKIPKIE